ncbi:MAG: DM13 domain-containing protein [Propionibacteriales bacterium]|nr:DM13 domain-containing protein [Propionibacteriales bacterium]
MKKRVLSTLAAIGAVLAVAALAFFEPWRAFTSSTLDEAAPSSVVGAPAARTTPPAPAASSGTPASTPRSTTAPDPAPAAAATPAPSPAPVDRDLSVGRFVNAEHETNGTARIIELADGRRYLRLEGFSTSDGPDVHVWLSEATAGGSWGKYDDNGYVKLGELKATDGNQNYLIPAGADISSMRSAVIWCDRFNVAFGAAPVKLAA